MRNDGTILARRIPRVAAIGGAILAMAFAVPAASAGELTVPAADGWYGWEVPASKTGARSCCYGWHRGPSHTRRACDLDGQKGGYSLSGDCDLDTGNVRIFVRMVGGQTDRVRGLSTECPVTTASEVTALGFFDADSSVEWLESQLTDYPERDGEVLSAISMHAGESALKALTRLLEDRNQPFSTREQALFWLVQSDTDEAYSYIDHLLSGLPL